MTDWDSDALKVCVIGNAKTGKTTLLHRIKTGSFVADLPQRLDEFNVPVNLEGKQMQVAVSDTLANDDRARRLAYMDTNCFLICFNYSDPASLSNVPTWVKDLTITHQCTVPTPYFLVGTCSDLDHAVTDAEVKAMKEKHDRILQVFDVSSKDGTGVSELWSAVTKAALKNNRDSAPQSQQEKQPKPSPQPQKTDTVKKPSNGGTRCQLF